MSWLEVQGREVIKTLLRPPGWRSADEVPPGTILRVGQCGSGLEVSEEKEGADATDAA